MPNTKDEELMFRCATLKWNQCWPKHPGKEHERCESEAKLAQFRQECEKEFVDAQWRAFRIFRLWPFPWQ